MTARSAKIDGTLNALTPSLSQSAISAPQFAQMAFLTMMALVFCLGRRALLSVSLINSLSTVNAIENALDRRASTISYALASVRWTCTSAAIPSA